MDNELKITDTKKFLVKAKPFKFFFLETIFRDSKNRKTTKKSINKRLFGKNEKY